MASIAHSRPRGFSVFVSLLLFIVLLGSTSAALARNSYQYTDSVEGDPGDGVLRPQPRDIDPEPVIEDRTFGVLFDSFLIMPTPGGRSGLLIPMLFFAPQQAGQPFPAQDPGPFGTDLRYGGRWHHAP